MIRRKFLGAAAVVLMGTSLVSAGSSAPVIRDKAADVVAPVTQMPGYQQSGPDVDINAALREANSHVTPSNGGLPAQSTFVAVYQGPDGRRYAVVDYTVPGAPQGKTVVSGVLLDELHIDHIRIVTYRDPATLQTHDALPRQPGPEPAGPPTFTADPNAAPPKTTQRPPL